MWMSTCVYVISQYIKFSELHKSLFPRTSQMNFDIEELNSKFVHNYRIDVIGSFMCLPLFQGILGPTIPLYFWGTTDGFGSILSGDTRDTQILIEKVYLKLIKCTIWQSHNETVLKTSESDCSKSKIKKNHLDCHCCLTAVSLTAEHMLRFG